MLKKNNNKNCPNNLNIYTTLAGFILFYQNLILNKFDLSKSTSTINFD